MTKRPADTIAVRANGREFDQFEKVEVLWDLTQPSQATFELGDEGAWEKLNEAMRPGTPWQVTINGSAFITGRGEILELTGDDNDGFRIVFTVRSRLSDAYVASADTNLKIEDSNVENFIMGLFRPIGFTENDFVFNQSTLVNLLTGQPSKMSTKKVDLEPIQIKQAKVQPGESVMDAATRHLERHGLLLCDLPDGRIGVFPPAPDAPAEYTLRLKRGGTRAHRQANNISRIKRSQDWTEVASELKVYGQTWGGDIEKASIYATAGNPEVIGAQAEYGHFNRKVVQVQNQIQDADQALRRARRQLTVLSKKQDAWDVHCDGVSYWDGSNRKRWAITGVAEFDIDITGGPVGKYFAYRVRLSQDSSAGGQSVISFMRSDLVRLQ